MVYAQHNSISISQKLVCQTYIIHYNNYKDKMKIVKTPQNSFQLISLRIPTHVLTNPQLWITHPLPLSGLMCLQPAVAASLAVPWDSSSFFLRLLQLSSQMLERRKRDWSLHLYYLHMIPFSPSTNIISQIPMVKECEIEFQTTYQNFTTIKWLTKSRS